MVYTLRAPLRALPCYMTSTGLCRLRSQAGCMLAQRSGIILGENESPLRGGNGSVSPRPLWTAVCRLQACCPSCFNGGRGGRGGRTEASLSQPVAVAGSWLTLGMALVRLPPSVQDTGVGVGIGDDSLQALLTHWVTLRQTLGPR